MARLYIWIGAKAVSERELIFYNACFSVCTCTQFSCALRATAICQHPQIGKQGISKDALHECKEFVSSWGIVTISMLNFTIVISQWSGFVFFTFHFQPPEATSLIFIVRPWVSSLITTGGILHLLNSYEERNMLYTFIKSSVDYARTF